MPAGEAGLRAGAEAAETRENAAVERMVGIDAGFLAMETPAQHMHTLKIAILDVSGSAEGYSFDRFRDVLASRLDRLPPFRRRVVEVPGRLHHPVFVDDPTFDLDAHLHQVQLDEPADREALDALISHIASEPLDRRRPLWDLSVVEGLRGGEIAFVAKLHHCIADGLTAAEMLEGVLDHDPHIEADVGATGSPWTPERLPSRRRLVAEALRDIAQAVARVPTLMMRSARGIRGAARVRREARAQPPLPFKTPTLSFNRAITPRRRFVSTTLSLSDVKAIRDALDCTVNDAVLALCTGALRRYLAGRGELPAIPLVASVPVAVPALRERRSAANNVSNLFAMLPVQMDEPKRRVAEIHDVMATAKRQLDELGPDLLAEWSEITPPLLFSAVIGLYSRLRLADLHRPPVNLVVSNVRGPSDPLWISGARVTEIASVGPILENTGLNITAWSYLDRLSFGILACEDTTPDVRDLADYLRDELAELMACTGRPS